MTVDIIVQNEEKKNRLSGLSVTSADRLEYFQSPSYYIAKKPHLFSPVLLSLSLCVCVCARAACS